MTSSASSSAAAAPSPRPAETSCARRCNQSTGPTHSVRATRSPAGSCSPLRAARLSPRPSVPAAIRRGPHSSIAAELPDLLLDMARTDTSRDRPWTCPEPTRASKAAGYSSSGAGDRPDEVDAADSGPVAETGVQAAARLVPLLVPRAELLDAVREPPVDLGRLQRACDALATPGSLDRGQIMVGDRRVRLREMELRVTDDLVPGEREDGRRRTVARAV